MNLRYEKSYHQAEANASVCTKNLMPFAESAAAEIRRLIGEGNEPEQAAALVAEQYGALIDATRRHDPQGAELELRFSLGGGQRWGARPDLGQITEAIRTVFPEKSDAHHREMALQETRRRWRSLLRAAPLPGTSSEVRCQAKQAPRESAAVHRPRSRETSEDGDAEDPDEGFRRRAASVATIREAVGVKFSDFEKSFWRIRLAQRGARGGLAHGEHF